MRRRLLLVLAVVTALKLVQLGLFWQKDAVLRWAVAEDRLSVMGIALEAGADVNNADRRGRTPIYRARSAEAVELLFLYGAYGAELPWRDHAGKTPLHTVDSVWAARALIAHGANLHAKDKSGRTPLQRASERWNTDLATTLTTAALVERALEHERQRSMSLKMRPQEDQANVRPIASRT